MMTVPSGQRRHLAHIHGSRNGGRTLCGKPIGPLIRSAHRRKTLTRKLPACKSCGTSFLSRKTTL